MNQAVRIQAHGALGWEGEGWGDHPGPLGAGSILPPGLGAQFVDMEQGLTISSILSSISNH